MSQNPYDQACRFLAKLNPMVLLAWLLRIPREEFTFERWLDTRHIAFHGQPDRTSDTVAFIKDVLAHGVPWALLIEFQTFPDHEMFGRMMHYLADVWLTEHPDPLPGSRFHVGAVVVNLTGGGEASRRMEWEKARLTTHLGIVEWNLEKENADELLTAIEGDSPSLCLLPWVALMIGGDDPATVDRWVRLAEREPNTRRKSDYAAVARVFAEKAGRKALWHEKLKGWNVEESTVLNELMEQTTKFKRSVEAGEARGEARGEAKALRTTILRVGTKKFGQGPTDAQRQLLDALTDPARLEGLVERLFDVGSWDDLLTVS